MLRGWIPILLLAACGYESDLVACGELLCPAGSTCTANDTCNNPLLPDGDGDGVIDLDDNCVLESNDSQSDVDHDGVGDECDNCPLLPNTEQKNVGDADEVGDGCDPHPTLDGDCLVLVDSFRTPELFPLHWRVFHATGDSSTFTPGDGFVQITPGGTGGATTAVLEGTTPYTGRFDVQIRAEAALGANGSIGALSAGGAGQGYICGVGRDNVGAAVELPNQTLQPTINPLLAEPVGDDLLLWLSVPAGTRKDLLCRATYGLALGVASYLDAPLFEGVAGFGVSGDPVKVQAFAMFRFTPGAACAKPIVR
ncbi:MAG TPA: thrombospondin type 3 repeat-containing protein [Kofleriaceae bacterium]|nr:thrombospondin type 3 repeat-containing protein [Kofleriaceae bacterium]